eukprot:330263_1
MEHTTMGMHHQRNDITRYLLWMYRGRHASRSDTNQQPFIIKHIFNENEPINTGIEDLIRIDTIKVWDYDAHSYFIDAFCAPKPFSNTDTRDLSSELLECCSWRDSHRYNNFALGGKHTTALQIVYVMFRQDVLNLANQAHIGKLSPPKITQIGVKTLPLSGAASSATFTLILHWNSEVYKWDDLRPSATNTQFMHTFTQSKVFCEFSRSFSLEIDSTSSAPDSVGIGQIIVTDEAGSSYNIDDFCNSNHIHLGEMCDDTWGAYGMFEGFIYNGSEPTHFIWADD